MSEVKLNNKLRQFLKDTGLPFHLQRHEGDRSLGIPDTSYGLGNTNGWIEQKYDAAFPIYYKSKIRDLQRTFLISRGIVAGNCFILHQLGDLYILLGYDKIIGAEGMKQDELLTYVDYWCQKKFTKDLVKHLTARQVKVPKINGITQI